MTQPAKHHPKPAANALRAALAVGALSFGAGPARGAALHLQMADTRQGSAGERTLVAACPPATLPDGDACVRVVDVDDAPEAEANLNAHHDRRGRWVTYDQIPRRPERPADYDAYRYPVPCEHGCVASGYDLDRPDDAQRRGRRLRHVGHGAVDLLQKRGTPVTLVALEHQVEDAEVVYVGPLFGTTVVTRHSLREGGQLRDYLVLYGHLDAPAPGLHAGMRLREGDPVGAVGDTGSPSLVHLHLEARRVRDGVDVAKLSPSAMIANESSVVCDPRNILPLR